MYKKRLIALIILVQVTFLGCHKNRERSIAITKVYTARITTLYDPLDNDEKVYCEILDRNGAIVVSKEKIRTTQYGLIDLEIIQRSCQDSVLVLQWKGHTIASYDLRFAIDR